MITDTQPSTRWTSWIDAFLALRSEAFGARGFDTSLHQRCPNTTNADAITIVAIFDPFVRTHGRDGLELRWRDVRADLARAMLVDPRETYARNSVFWSTLEATCARFDDQAIEPPDASTWSGLVAELSAPIERRNAGPAGDGPFKHFDVKTFDELYLAQYQYLRELRGADVLAAEAGSNGFPKPIPRTTNADVVLLADYWSKQLANVRKVFGHESVEKRWKEIVADVDASARRGDPKAVYVHNNTFWRVLGTTSTHVATADEAPSSSSLALDSLVHSIEALPGRVADVVSGGAEAVAHVGGAAALGFLSAFKTPLLLGGGLVALYLIARKED